MKKILTILEFMKFKNGNSLFKIGVFILILMVGFLINSHIKAKAKAESSLQYYMDKQNRELLKLQENIVRAQSEQGELTKSDIDKIVSKEIEKIINKNDEIIKQIGRIKATIKKSKAVISKPVKSTTNITKDNIIEKEDFHVIRLNEGSEKPGPNIAWFLIKRFCKNSICDIEVKKGSYALTFEVNTTLTEQVSGGWNNYVEMSIIGTEEDDEWYNKPYPIGIDNANFKFVRPDKFDKKLRLWNPHIDLAGSGSLINGGLGYGLDIGFSISSYGITDSDNDFRFFRIGLDYSYFKDDSSIGGSFAPIGVNVAKKMPIFSDIWLWGGVLLTEDGYGPQILIGSTF